MSLKSIMVMLFLLLLCSSMEPDALGQANDRSALRGHYELQEGRRLYEQYCRFCHGEQGKGKAYDKVTPPPADLTAETVQGKSDTELMSIIHEGEPGSPMGAWKWALSEQDKRNVLRYIRSLAH